MSLTADLHFRLQHNLTPLLHTFPRSHSVPTLLLPRFHSSLRLKLTSLPIHCRRPHVIRRNLAGVVASAEEIVGSVNENDDEGVLGTKDDNSLGLEDGDKKRRDLKNRLVFGIGIGVSAGGIVLTGGLLFAVFVAVGSFMAAGEYFEMVRNHGIVMGIIPPPIFVSQLCSAFCFLMPLLTLEKPCFTQLSNTIFGLFYCGYLPCFWVKLRCSLAVPSINTNFNTFWPILFGGSTHWTVGLCAALISISSIIAADTFAFLGGKIFGHTPLTNISPKKTLEGAFAGLTGCVCTAVMLSRILCWPASLPSAAAFGTLNFVGSISGDLIESIIKRDAGVKDSGDLIPGHGGILDRVDSYVFTGALSYSFVIICFPLFGV